MHSLGLVWLWLYMSYGVYGKLYSVSAVILLCISGFICVGGHWQVKKVCTILVVKKNANSGS